MIDTRAAVSLIPLCLAAGQALAQNDEAAELRAEIDALRARLDAIEAPAGSSRSLDFSGDLRYRHETINDDASAERNRHRIRARFRMNAELSEDLEVGITLATGASNPVSANQSLDGGFSRKDIGFDRAYFDWSINDEVSLTGGKMGISLFRPGGHHLIFDSDLNPEGLQLSYEGDRVFANLASFWVEERSSTSDALLYALQGGFNAELGDNVELTIGAGYLDYKNTQGFEPFYLGEPQGNIVDGAGNLVNDYDLAEIFAEARLEAGGYPLRIFLDYVENTAADQFETGYAFGVRWRSTSNPGDWDVRWAYEDLEADAVIATFTDSDFIGGGTDGKGHVFRAGYQLRNNVRLNGTYFLNERGAAAGNERDYKRLQLDINFLF